MKFILGKKIGMSQVFVNKESKREVIPVSVVEASPCVVTQVKTIEKDGYAAVQIGSGSKKKINKPLSGHVKELGKFRYLAEFRSEDEKKEYKVGEKIEADIFEAGDKIKVSGKIKSKGFQGVMKRHGFRGGPASHGQKHSNRKPGSIASRRTGKVEKGKRMAGRMGGTNSTQMGLKVVDIDKKNNLILIKGAIPGSIGALVRIVSE